MTSEWMVSHTWIGGCCFHQVYRIKDLNEVNHAGNRETYGTYDTDEEAQRIAAELNIKEGTETYRTR